MARMHSRSEEFAVRLAIALSVVRLLGLLAFVVHQRTPEIGVRMALRADADSVIWMILRRTLLLVAIGIALA